MNSPRDIETPNVSDSSDSESFIDETQILSQSAGVQFRSGEPSGGFGVSTKRRLGAYGNSQLNTRDAKSRKREESASGRRMGGVQWVPEPSRSDMYGSGIIGGRRDELVDSQLVDQLRNRMLLSSTRFLSDHMLIIYIFAQNMVIRSIIIYSRAQRRGLLWVRCILVLVIHNSDIDIFLKSIKDIWAKDEACSHEDLNLYIILWNSYLAFMHLGNRWCSIRNLTNCWFSRQIYELARSKAYLGSLVYIWRTGCSTRLACQNLLVITHHSLSKWHGSPLYWWHEFGFPRHLR